MVCAFINMGKSLHCMQTVFVILPNQPNFLSVSLWGGTILLGPQNMHESTVNTPAAHKYRHARTHPDKYMQISAKLQSRMMLHAKEK